MATGELRWVYPYTEDLTIGAKERAERVGRVPLRPVVQVALRGPKGSQRVPALVDSGSEHTLAGLWLSRATGVVPDEHAPELEIGIGGLPRLIRLVDIALQLYPPPGVTAEPIEWRTQIGFIMTAWEPPWPVLLGQVGFYDRFTVSMSRFVQAFAIEGEAAFDRRYGVAYAEAEDELWRMPY